MSETEILGNCLDCGTDIFDDGGDELWCDECSYRLCHDCSRRCERCYKRVCDEHRCKDECCDGAYCQDCHQHEYGAEGDSGCCICGADYGRYGNNPDPVKSSGRCCDTCNATVVIPARLSMMGFSAEEDEIMAQMYEIEDKANPTEEDLKNYANLETRMYELTRMSSEENTQPIMPPMGFGEMVNWRPMDGTPGLKRQRAEAIKVENVAASENVKMIYVSTREAAEEEAERFIRYNFPEDRNYAYSIRATDQPDRWEMEYEWIPQGGEYDAEGVSEEVTNRLQKLAVGFTGMTVVFTAIGAIGGYLLGRNAKR